MALIIVSFTFLYLSRIETTKIVKTTETEEAAPKKATTAPEVKTTLFCLQMDGLQDGHLPAGMGEKAKDAYPNGLKDGYNWNLQWTSTGSEPYGIMPDGTLFAKESFLKEYGMVSSVALKCDATNWAPESLEKGVVNNETAYIYKLK